MRRKRILAFVSAAVLICCLTGCQGDIGATAVDTEQVTEQSAALTKSADETEPKYRKEYDEDGNLYLINNKTDEIIPPFPEGWSGERISKMVTIDGYQLTLPCKVSDILALSDDFRLDDPFDFKDGTSGYQIWYKDVIAASGVFDNESNMILTMNIGGNEYTKFENVNSTLPDEIYLLFDGLPKGSDGSICVKYFQGNVRYGLQYFGRGKVLLVWEEM